jgi:hypothetical protein
VPRASSRHLRHAARRTRIRHWSEAALVVVAYLVFFVGSSSHVPFSTHAPTHATTQAAPPQGRSQGRNQAPFQAPATSLSYFDQVEAGRKLLGVAPTGIKTDLTSLDSFSREIGRQPDVVEFYQSFTEPFDTSVAAATSATGALPLDSWGPAGADLADIASGNDDAYITSFADEVRDYGSQLALAVGHEMNAPWSSWWGGGPAEAPMFVAAWQHIHAIFKQQGADNVIWVWTVNIEAGGAAWPGSYYPGDAYVDWIGVDGYFHQGLPTTFDALFGPTLADLRAHYAKPILVVETGALPTPLRPAEIQSAFNAVLASPDLIGFIWFDYDLQSTEGVDWYLDDDHSSLAVYRRGATAARFALRTPVAADTADTADTAPFNQGSTP